MRVVGFVCERGPGPAAELAGERGLHYSPSVTLIRMPCGGRLETFHVLKAFREGADAVFVACCLEGNCHHVYGNLEAARRVELAKGLLDEVGLGSWRLELYHVASNQAFMIPRIAKEMTERVERKGESPLGAKR